MNVPGFDFERRLVGDELLPEGWKPLHQFVAAPKETHVGCERLVAGTDKVVAVPGLNVDGGVRTIVNAVQKELQRPTACAALATALTSIRVPRAWDVTVQATKRVFSERIASRSSR